MTYTDATKSENIKDDEEHHKFLLVFIPVYYVGFVLLLSTYVSNTIITSSPNITSQVITDVGIIVTALAIVISIVIYEIIYNATIIKKGKSTEILKRIHQGMKKCFDAYTEDITERKKEGIVSAIVILDKCRTDMSRASKLVSWAIIDMIIMVATIVLSLTFVSPFGVSAAILTIVYISIIPFLDASSRLITLWNLYSLIEDFEIGEESTIAAIARYYKRYSIKRFDYESFDKA
jgi:hypothetical protein